ncbi:alpha/beta hydrolase [Mycobacterium sp. CBMA293]|uniref:alpha/beta hydrolase n=1 Tax=unclassified Mycolicibacterium TaxID=2636767 RepID=UPI0012DDB4B9|nr:MULTISPECIES: alpha/beta hydrolase [unclassified Mycolicibacterium]MUL45550.1 alpha/beta hydrolase [Mycolicibacterium sp. CBMA 360]MUL60220.1 alpha/beta hydrolase [Mycolicibacterium sp. CBMA 335]MUL71568.1 alpha/beta hydrolase [Mycolicibacterium sp. CBMA 311]MUL73007.1 alpha/beta hydrolase [Mycolicibacterium sp. CBMA 311]MUL96018.1 alpha/beta hydrolase [Mycolicibacterium sp. CBMA 230]
MNLRRGSLAFAATMAVVLVGATGCGQVIDGHAVRAVPKPGSPLQWSPCQTTTADSQSRIPKGAECAMLSVPVDYSKPDGDVTQLALIRIKATGDKIGSLVINPGGPGESGVSAAVSLLNNIPDSVRQRFDLVGFDPRGVGSSKPAVWCNSDADNDRQRADPQVDYSPAGVAHIESETKDFVQRCVDKMGKDFLANVGTASVAKDLDAIRAALGDDKLTYLGYSYGTRIGAQYAEDFPDKVRSMILDGAVDPNADPIEADINQAAAFQGAFNNYAADCATNPDCPLGTDPTKINDVYHSLVDPLVQKPAPTKDPRGLSYGDALVGTILPLYSPAMWKDLTAGLTELKGGHGDIMLKLADAYMGRDSDGHYDNSTDARVAVNCVDEPPVTDRAKVIDEDKRTREVAPFMSYGQFTGDAPLGTCAFWPVPPTSKPHKIAVKGLPPTLVVSTIHDPATPYKAGVDLAKELGGGLLTFDGTQHTVVFQGNTCVDDHASSYLINGAVPDAGAKC